VDPGPDLPEAVFGLGLGHKADQGFGVGGAEVEPEVVSPEGHPVEVVGFEAVGAKLLLHRGQGGLAVGDGVVELPGGEVFLQGRQY